MAQSRQLALKYGETLSPEITHLVIAQSLLPWLWEAGYLGGRTFDLLLTTLPIKYLQERLDLAAKSHPTSSTLGDFRAATEVAELEMSALNLARKLITPHSDLAKLFPAKTELLDWVMPSPLDLPKLDLSQTRPTIVLPCSSLGRKGIYELRSAMAGIDGDGSLTDFSVSFTPVRSSKPSLRDLVLQANPWIEKDSFSFRSVNFLGNKSIVFSQYSGLYDLNLNYTALLSRDRRYLIIISGPEKAQELRKALATFKLN
jgi:hypothetical protein